MEAHDIQELQKYPAVHDFVRTQVSMQFGDVRAMLRLPLPELGIAHGCNFAATAILCNLLSGLSVSLFRPTRFKKSVVRGSVRRRGRIGTRDYFKKMVYKYFPWQAGEEKRQKTSLLYTLVRCTLAHSLGVGDNAKVDIQLGKTGLRRKGRGLTNREIDKLEASVSRPAWLPLTHRRRGKAWHICVESLYRDVFHLLRNLARDEEQMEKADKRIAKKQVIHHRQ
jgi:hypothetical protein